MPDIYDDRITLLNDAPVKEGGLYVLYWLRRVPRTYWSYPLQRAADHARALAKPLVVCDPLLIEEGSTARSHRFRLDAMADCARRLDLAGVLYYPYLETTAGAGLGLLDAVAARSCGVIVDQPASRLSTDSASRSGVSLTVPFESVDGEGFLPLGVVEKETASNRSAFRSLFRSTFRGRLMDFPERNPIAKFHETRLEALLPSVTTKWPIAPGPLLAGSEGPPSSVPIDHTIAPSGDRGGSESARPNWRSIEATMRTREPFDPAAIEVLRKHLGAGHISVHQILAETMRTLGWNPSLLANENHAEPTGWWGLDDRVELFLDELLVERERAIHLEAH